MRSWLRFDATETPATATDDGTQRREP